MHTLSCSRFIALQIQFYELQLIVFLTLFRSCYNVRGILKLFCMHRERVCVHMAVAILVTALVTGANLRRLIKENNCFLNIKLLA